MINEQVFYKDLQIFLGQFNNIPNNLSPEQDLFVGGWLQSLALVSLVVHLEQQFSVQLNENDLHEDNFRNMKCIFNLISHKGQ